MKKKKAIKLINEILDQEYDYIDKGSRIIVAKYITKHTGKALYYNSSSGKIVSCKIDFRDTSKYEDKNYKLMRFDESYLSAAKEIALCFMKNNSTGYGLYAENGIVVG